MSDSDSPTRLTESVRRHCAAVAASARWVTVDEGVEPATGGIEGLDPELHFLGAEPEEVARYVLVLDAINFGSGWFPSLALGPRESGTEAITRRLTEHARRRGGTWTADELDVVAAAEVAGVLSQDPGHELMELYATALRQLGSWLRRAPALERIAAAEGSADRFAGRLAAELPFFDDRGFYKRAQITANDLVHAGVADFGDIDELTAFADNLVPHVLRIDGVLELDDDLVARIEAGELIEHDSPEEVEIRACAVHAVELLVAARGQTTATAVDNTLWGRGAAQRYKAHPRHRARTTAY